MTNSTHIALETIAPYADNTGARVVKLFRNGANQAAFAVFSLKTGFPKWFSAKSTSSPRIHCVGSYYIHSK